MSFQVQFGSQKFTKDYGVVLFMLRSTSACPLCARVLAESGLIRSNFTLGEYVFLVGLYSSYDWSEKEGLESKA